VYEILKRNLPRSVFRGQKNLCQSAVQLNKSLKVIAISFSVRYAAAVCRVAVLQRWPHVVSDIYTVDFQFVKCCCYDCLYRNESMKWRNIRLLRGEVIQAGLLWLHL